MPIRIRFHLRPGRRQLRHLLLGQLPVHDIEVLPQLRLAARAHDRGGHARPLDHPAQRDLRDRFARLRRHLIQGVHHPVNEIILRRRQNPARPLVVEPAHLRLRLTAAHRPAQSPHAQRTPRHQSHALIQRQRHQLPLILATQQRIIRLMRHVALPAPPLRNRQRFHKMPAGKVGAPNVADLARAHQVIERTQGFLDRRHGVERVQLIQVDMVGTQPLQTALDRRNDMVPRMPHIIRPLPRPERALGGNEQLIPLPLDGSPQHRLGHTTPVDIGRVEHRHAMLETNIDEPRRQRDIHIAPAPIDLRRAKRARAQRQHRHPEPTATQLTVFHGEEGKGVGPRNPRKSRKQNGNRSTPHGRAS